PWAHELAGSGLALDVGAGSGRDARWLAGKGYEVIAVEPGQGFRRLALNSTLEGVRVLDDSLPDLKKLRKYGYRFDVILVNAVWMHVPPPQRDRAFRILANLLAPNGILVFSTRQASPEESAERGFHPIPSAELAQLAASHALVPVIDQATADSLGRANLEWRTQVFRFPTDSTGALPLLRHVIVNDDKSATYKLGLLRTVVRIAEQLPGAVLSWQDESVTIPFGLVGLYWIKLYMPLVLTHQLAQRPADGRGMGWAKQAFYALDDMPNGELRLGATFTGDKAAMIGRAIGDACANIAQMPVHFTTYPGSDVQVFNVERRAVRQRERSIRLDKEFLAQYGTFTVPRHLWDAMGQFGCWIDPAISGQWKSLLQGWNKRQGVEADIDLALQWEGTYQGKRDTTEVRSLVTRLREQDQVRCVWTGTRLLREFQIDHCIPWSYWANNDLWNLMPSTTRANNQKRDRLPSISLLAESRPRILDWWVSAFDNDHFRDRFMIEAGCSLPGIEASTFSDVYTALQFQQTRLKRDQQLPEWPGALRARGA
ncbi:MAG: methyltransferase domain-containing protein, partial [Halioglobus sp.]|nr:methyltransferase domain-containing protein [Halioglobus sp.]